MSAGRTLTVLTTRALLSFAILAGIASTACIASEKKHDIQGLELGMPRHDALEKLKSMNCTNITAGDALSPKFSMSFQCPNNINFDIGFAERLTGFPLYELQAKFEGILAPEEQVKSIEQQFGVTLSPGPSGGDDFIGSLGQDRKIIFVSHTDDGATIHDFMLTLFDDKLEQDDQQAEQDSTRQKFSAPTKF